MARALLDGDGMCASPRLVLLVITVAASAVGCATPQPLVRLDPRGTKDVVWVAGRAVVAKERGGVRVATAFEVQDGSMLALRLEIENQLPQPIEVSPSDFTFVKCATAADDSCVGAFSIIDPEQVLAALDERQSRERADAANEAALNTSLVLLSAVGDVASIASRRPHPTTGLRTVALAEQGQAAAARADATIASLGTARATWSNVAFRRTTIAAGAGAGGLIYLPIDVKAQFVWLYIRAAGQEVPFGFRQTVRELNSTRRAPPTNPMN